MPPRTEIKNKNLVTAYMWTTIGAGGLIYFLAAAQLDTRILDPQFGVLVVITLFLSSRLTIKIPQSSSHISVSDTLIFLDSFALRL